MRNEECKKKTSRRDASNLWFATLREEENEKRKE
jgi:hypothetical protein